MRPAQEIMAALATSGLTTDQLALVMELSAAVATEARPVEDGAAKRRRAKDRQYQADRRRQSRQISADAPPNEDTSNPGIPPVDADASTAPRGRVERGKPIAEDWTPPAPADLSTEAAAMASQWPQIAYRAEAEAFRNYWLAETGKNSRKSNWDRAWANRIVAVHSRVMRANRPTAPPGNDMTALYASIDQKYGQQTTQ